MESAMGVRRRTPDTLLGSEASHFLQALRNLNVAWCTYLTPLLLSTISTKEVLLDSPARDAFILPGLHATNFFSQSCKFGKTYLWSWAVGSHYTGVSQFTAHQRDIETSREVDVGGSHIWLCLHRYLKLAERFIGLLLSLKLVTVLNGLGPKTVQFSLRKGGHTTVVASHEVAHVSGTCSYPILTSSERKERWVDERKVAEARRGMTGGCRGGVGGAEREGRG